MPDAQLRAFILAAGRGERLWPLTRDRPKSLIDLGDGATILGRQLDVLRAHPQIERVTIVTGHRAEVIEEFIAPLEPFVDTCFNPFYAGAGPLGSLWTVRDRIEESDFVILNGDTLFRSAVLDAAIAGCDDETGVVLVASTAPDPAHDDVRVRTSPEGYATAVGKEVEGASARSAGILLVRGDAERRRARSVLDALVRDEASLALATPWHSWVDQMARAPRGVRVVLVDDVNWSEVDIHPELDELRSELASKLK